MPQPLLDDTSCTIFNNSMKIMLQSLRCKLSHSHPQHPNLVMETIQQLLVSTLGRLDTEPFMNVEVSLRFFFMMGEVLPDKVTNGGHVSW